ncbi:MAG: nucleotide pyrophosphohydrolase [Gammaproteobacteria bacterium]|nr:MAG: nucleotide pyrophosphohydrolase [Gammaproteobacteria bacterium]
MDTRRILEAFDRIARERNWLPLQTPKNLAIALANETAELLHEFQWLTDEQVDEMNPKQRERVAHEAADILMYLLALCDRMGIDLEQAVEAKIAINEERFLK